MTMGAVQGIGETAFVDATVQLGGMATGQALGSIPALIPAAVAGAPAISQVTRLGENDVVVGIVREGRIINAAAYGADPSLAPSHEWLARQAGVLVERGVLSQGSEAFTVIKQGGQIFIRGSNNFNPSVSEQTRALIEAWFQ